MLYSRLLIPTLKEDPAEAEVISHKLMMRAGMIRKIAAGIYTYLPLGWRTVRKVAEIVRQEMDKASAQEVLLPIVQPKELWDESGRWDYYGRELLRLKDRHEREFCLGPTAEEVITDLVRREVKSYRQLPINLYQIQTKFRDEIRPRFGLMRGREFIMKDGYSFHKDNESAEAEYWNMYETYKRIFTRCGLNFRAVEADTGNIGGSFSHEFMVLAETGEDFIASCDSCDYAANVEKAECKEPEKVDKKRISRGMFDEEDEVELPKEPVPTPGKKTVEEVAEFLGVKPSKLVKTLIYKYELYFGIPQKPGLKIKIPDELYWKVTDMAANAGKKLGEFVEQIMRDYLSTNSKPDVIAVLVPGDQEVNEIKLKQVMMNFFHSDDVEICLASVEVELADKETVEKITGAPSGFAGPVGLNKDVRIFADNAVKGMTNFITGGNEADTHLRNVNLARDFKVDEFADLRNIVSGDPCPKCAEGKIEIFKGIEVGHIFMLGTKYSEAMNCKFLDEDGSEKPMIMGCYGIGVGRTAAAAIEQNNDKDGIKWPAPLAPFEVVVLPLNINNEEVMNASREIYNALLNAGVEALLDDRDLRAGFKFKDADLIGFPVSVVVGEKNLSAGMVEVKRRSTGEMLKVPKDEAAARAAEIIGK
jgi:prolyl-tRNA synthetase